jgi:hypothetical protein
MTPQEHSTAKLPAIVIERDAASRAQILTDSGFLKNPLATRVTSPLPQHEEPVLGEHWQDRGDRVVEQVEAGDEGP